MLKGEELGFLSMEFSKVVSSIIIIRTICMRDSDDRADNNPNLYFI